MARRVGRPVESVKQKMRRLGLLVGTRGTVVPTTTSPEIVLPEELPTVEETLKKLAGALDMVCKGGLRKTEELARWRKEMEAEWAEDENAWLPQIFL